MVERHFCDNCGEDITNSTEQISVRVLRRGKCDFAFETCGLICAAKFIEQYAEKEEKHAN